jgi:hypothetical protein
MTAKFQICLASLSSTDAMTRWVTPDQGAGVALPGRDLLASWMVVFVDEAEPRRP